MQNVKSLAVALLLLPALAFPAQAHDGPPFPIVTERPAGPYRISVWTDPDATDDGTAGGQFWVTVEPGAGAAEVPAATRATVSVRALGGEGAAQSAPTEPVGAAVSPQYAALRLDHEGRYAVRVVVDGPLGAAEIDAAVDATYDLRPAPIMLVVYLVPFVLAGTLWVKVLLRRRRA